MKETLNSYAVFRNLQCKKVKLNNNNNTTTPTPNILFVNML